MSGGRLLIRRKASMGKDFELSPRVFWGIEFGDTGEPVERSGTKVNCARRY